MQVVKLVIRYTDLASTVYVLVYPACEGFFIAVFIVSTISLLLIDQGTRHVSACDMSTMHLLVADILPFQVFAFFCSCLSFN